MNIVVGRPPNFERLAAVFPVTANTIFTYGPTIYVPSGAKLPVELVEHEATHAYRQGTTEAGIEAWWDRYIADPEFRFEEELRGHVAEYRKFCKRVADSNKRVRFLMGTVAKRLASPLYGGLVSEERARQLILEAGR